MEIEASQVRRDVPAGSEVEITIEINESRLLRTKAYIPLLDEEFEHVVILGKLEPKTEDLNRDFEEQKKRLEAVRGKARSTGSMAAQEKLARIDDEQMVHDVEASLAASGIDRDAADKCQNRLRDLKSAIDEIEDALEWPALLAEAEEAIKNTGDVVREHGDNADRQKFAAMEGEIRRTMGHAVRDPDVLRRGIGEIQSLSFQILRQKPGFWIGWLNHLESMKSEMRDQTQAEQYFAQGRRAINNNDVPALVSAVQQLFGLLPVERARKAGLYGGTTQKG